MVKEELTSRQLRFFEIARRLSKKSDHHRHWLGCVLVRGTTVIGYGWNLLKTHSKARNKYKMLHAEVHATIGLLPREIRGADAYVYRENRAGQLALAKPCIACEKMLNDLGVRRVYYTTDNGYNFYIF